MGFFSPGSILDKVLGSLVWNTAFLLCCQISEGYRKKTCKYSASKLLALFHSLFLVVKKISLIGYKTIFLISISPGVHVILGNAFKRPFQGMPWNHFCVFKFFHCKCENATLQISVLASDLSQLCLGSDDGSKPLPCSLSS